MGKILYWSNNMFREVLLFGIIQAAVLRIMKLLKRHALREFKEETGYDVVITRLLFKSSNKFTFCCKDY
jgi:8-oxo-dGTP pyrophosphatase MutT (NUDIX family)